MDSIAPEDPNTEIQNNSNLIINCMCLHLTDLYLIAYNRLMRAILETRENESKERKEMEGRINSRLDVIMKTLRMISNQVDETDTDEILDTNSAVRFNVNLIIPCQGVPVLL